jgi:hypothetical protein
VLNSVIDNNVGNDSYDDAYENDIGPVDIPLLPVEMVFIGLMSTKTLRIGPLRGTRRD